MALDLMAAVAGRHSGISGLLVLLAFVASSAAHAQASSAPAEPVDNGGQPCGAIRALPANVTDYRYEVTNRCERPVTFYWRCNAADPEHAVDVAAKGQQSTTCVKASGAAGEIVFRFGPPGAGN
ncbi:hypothetical protein AB870_18980 [Pandoraea faecigallinarum]|uniref:Uncharacterized protein n=1 Tax=Pandoraea faecigallinarum TaxID=656179 RepID=A0A0H3WU47_9BURK|nr:hypothetical protein [Pandoraea faecigallinarum]AKM31744.1 hypothetical protein AB870_18980 [Pandoraea faecigallinarum]